MTILFQAAAHSGGQLLAARLPRGMTIGLGAFSRDSRGVCMCVRMVLFFVGVEWKSACVGKGRLSSVPVAGLFEWETVIELLC